MNAEKRKKKIQDLLKNSELTSVSDIQKALDVSIATIRRDLNSLEKAGLIRRTHGGAMLRKRSLFEATYQERENKLIREKELIAKKAIGFIKDGDRIFINDGTTSNQIAKLMAQKDFPYKLVIITNSLRAADILLSNTQLDVIFVGGMINGLSYACTGPLTELVLDHLKADKALIAADGFDPLEGPSIELMPEASVTRKMIAIADQTIVIGDATKMNTRAFMKISSWNEIDIFITDFIQPEDRKTIESFNVHIPSIE